MDKKVAIIGNGVKLIPLSKGKYTIVDEDMFTYLNQWKWHLSAKGYAVRKPGNKCIFMHRLINNTLGGYQTDHINKNKLDNRKTNLRTLDNQQNHFNMPLQKNNTSGYIGVNWDKDRNKWMARIVINDRQIHLGRYTDLQEAVMARKKAERIYHAI